MAELPSPTEVAGNHVALYEALYQQVDPAGIGCVGAVEAAEFLKKSGLSDAVLGKIWDFSDPNGKGYLDKKGLFVSLKLIALVQNGQNVDMANIKQQVPPPDLGPTSLNRKMSTVIDWSIKPSERKKYEEMFNSLKPTNDKLPGSKVKPIMLNSKLPLETLGKIWELSDIDQDGFLDRDEFILAMHLVYKALENVPIPSELPPDLIPVSKRKSSLAGAIPVLPDLLPGMDGGFSGHRSSTPTMDLTAKNIHNTTAVPWVVTATDKAKYDEIFHKLDQDQDGFVTGPDVKDTFIQSGLFQNTLAYIWCLCDVKENGKLNSEQFALALYLINLKLQGGDIPSKLTPDMIPPSLRPKPTNDSFSLQDGLTVVSSSMASASSKELDMMNTEVKELQKEKIQLEQDIAQKEADMKIRSGELKTLQNEAEALSAMLKQLEVQKREAQKRLDDLDNQKTSVENSLSDLKQKVEEDAQQVGSLKKQVEDQKKVLKDQEETLNKKRCELNELRQEEAQLEQRVESKRSELEVLTQTLQKAQTQVSQTKEKVIQLQDQQTKMQEALEQFDSAVSTDNLADIIESSLQTFTPTSFESEYQKLSNTDDPFKAKDPFSEVNGFTDQVNGYTDQDSVNYEDTFKGDPLKCDGTTSKGFADPFGWDPFNDGLKNHPPEQKQNPSDQEQKVNVVDPFQSTDPFGSFPATSSVSVTPDPFSAGGANQVSSGSDLKFPSDPFGTDPFNPTRVAPPRPESPTPALPPKKSKAPPPRPAPPKHFGGGGKSGPTRAAPAPPLPPSVHDPFIAGSAKSFSSNSTKIPVQTFQIKASSQDAFESAFESSQLSERSNGGGQGGFDPFGTSGINDPFASSNFSHQDFANFSDFEKLN
ncbi:epidermal growth factor receptor substrate 15-like 1 isoform X3 [Limulus polyphemus]|uniref:Epidermal growth factor receptor substrate 15-like 1 isoform X3 n=1 Tax=Limulus polyphemus TaxID=6850 RepID=A0ABM1SCH8_LIMPO|nr:epidermal growth factor receptor substrate 15-like 1 isoform X3 [Limulus polyphemus]